VHSRSGPASADQRRRDILEFDHAAAPQRDVAGDHRGAATTQMICRMMFTIDVLARVSPADRGNLSLIRACVFTINVDHASPAQARAVPEFRAGQLELSRMTHSSGVPAGASERTPYPMMQKSIAICFSSAFN
jgi:hypothetical protein